MNIAFFGDSPSAPDRSRIEARVTDRRRIGDRPTLSSAAATVIRGDGDRWRHIYVRSTVRTDMDATDVTDLYQEFGDERLPPGQRETTAFPVLSKSGTPDWDPETWEFTVTGAVEEELTFSWEEFRELPSVTQRQDFHCVTGWSKFDCSFTGVSFPELAERAGVDPEAVHAMFSGLDGYTTDLPLEDCLREEVLFAWAFDGEALPEDHGGPLRVVTPHKYAYKGAKWVDGIEFLTEPQRGYWERRGYSQTANPWEEQRYS